MAVGGLGYALAWLLARHVATRSAAVITLVAVSTACAVYYITQVPTTSRFPRPRCRRSTRSDGR